MSLIVDIKKKYKGFTLEAAFSSDEGTLALLGASGSGKSMTLKCIAGLISPDEGVIIADGRVLYDSTAKIDLRPQERGVGYLFQNYALFPNMTVRQNIAIAHRGGAERRDADIDALFARYELEGLEDRYPVQLSGGQQQRAALARIFAYRPKVLLLDEPFSALDTFLRENMQAELKRVIREYDGSVVLVTHNRDEAYKLADDLVILDRGRATAAGPVREVFAHPVNVRAARITGCKNISAIEKTGDHSFFAKDWGVELKTEEPIEERHFFAGIRAHDFVPVKDKDRDKDKDKDNESANGREAGGNIAAEEPNWFLIEFIDETDGPFEKDVIFRAEGGTGSLWWIADRGTDASGIHALSIAPEKILLLEQ